MDGSLNNAGSATTARVARQFRPSRIERQLLTQVFELVCSHRREVDQSGFERQCAAAADRVGNHEQAIVVHVSGRRAA